MWYRQMSLRKVIPQYTAEYSTRSGCDEVIKNMNFEYTKTQNECTNGQDRIQAHNYSRLFYVKLNPTLTTSDNTPEFYEIRIKSLNLEIITNPRWKPSNIETLELDIPTSGVLCMAELTGNPKLKSEKEIRVCKRFRKGCSTDSPPCSSALESIWKVERVL